ncbi:hypothetical protein OESDEN_02910 [Oesophagostomum dentatum]|uniref:Uncharacterized protein n=1 Tax=Oesophagostomum dentatum TaxID=61180 RepID=A0A0B1TP22_OESDE|nr:hypothetical protein OESDEN_02910 [Oesophagostomum dentatum]
MEWSVLANSPPLRKSTKRQCIDSTRSPRSPSQTNDLDHQTALLLNDQSSNLNESTSVVAASQAQPTTDQLLNERPTPTSSQPSRTFEKIERSRSVVLAGLPECDSDRPSAKRLHDYNFVDDTIDYCPLNVHLSIYRMGRVNPDPSLNHKRLIKIILPASYFARSMLRGAPHLRLVQGLFLRSSLPKAERDKMRAECMARRCNAKKPSPSNNVENQTTQVLPNNCNSQSVANSSSPTNVSASSGLNK